MIKLLVSIAGADFSHAPGETVSFDAETEKRLIESGQAEPAKAEKTTASKSAKKG
ncbi:MAG TPA: hypothetical protein PLC58_03185 [Denitromonas sp.]|nr:hypothetical protein [Denitromonas sp.]